jgi:hypothetical protein
MRNPLFTIMKRWLLLLLLGFWWSLLVCLIRLPATQGFCFSTTPSSLHHHNLIFPSSTVSMVNEKSSLRSSRKKIVPLNNSRNNRKKAILLAETTTDTNNVIQSTTREQQVVTVVPTTWSQAYKVFFQQTGPQLCTLLLLATILGRISLMTQSTLSLVDGGILLGTMIVWCFQEHVLHAKVLHSDMDWYGKTIHEQHHNQPYHHISIDPAWLMVTWMMVVHVIFRCMLPLPWALTATIGYTLAGMWYEFVHYMVHTKVRFSPHSYFAKLKTHHARHHNINPHYWFGFSFPVVDTLWGTNPSITNVIRTKQHKRRLSATNTNTIVPPKKAT